MDKAYYATHNESWTLPQDQREIADYFAAEWKTEGRTVHMTEDTGSIKVESIMLIRFDESGQVEEA